MLKEHLLAANSILFALSGIFWMYGIGTLVIQGNWLLFGISTGVFFFFLAAQAILAIIQ